MCAAILCLEAIALGLTTPVMMTIADVSAGTALVVGLGLAVVCLLLAGMLRGEWAYALGWVVQVAAIGLGLRGADDVRPRAVFALLWGGARTSSAARSSASGPPRTPHTRPRPAESSRPGAVIGCGP